MKNLLPTLFLAAACTALAGCANNEFTRTATRAPDSAAEQMCGGVPAQTARSRGPASRSDPQREFCLQEMQGEDLHR